MSPRAPRPLPVPAELVRAAIRAAEERRGGHGRRAGDRAGRSGRGLAQHVAAPRRRFAAGGSTRRCRPAAWAPAVGDGARARRRGGGRGHRCGRAGRWHPGGGRVHGELFGAQSVRHVRRPGRPAGDRLRAVQPTAGLPAHHRRPGHRATETVGSVSRAMAGGLSREPAMAPAMLADMLRRRDGPAGRLSSGTSRRIRRAWRLAGRRGAGRSIQASSGPVAAPATDRAGDRAPADAPGTQSGDGDGDPRSGSLPDLDETCALFADAFVRAVSQAGPMEEG